MGYQVGRICYSTEAEALNIVMTQVVPMIDKDGVLHHPVFNGRTWTYKQQGHEYPVKPTFPQCDPNEYTNAGREVGIALLGAFVVVWIIRAVLSTLNILKERDEE
ncbi:hypothetical protein [Neisseria lactamica]|uniref:hypothetical protein n=1 Tax=Neisseria lactamica TaxID=486 RepID=UPI000E567B35|nr:hypothetical protein [Neisseria lactamica]